MRGYDKWQAYLPIYEQVIQKIKPGSAYLEIGVQNMGWLDALDPEKLFTRSVACDINPAVAEHAEGTRFTDIIIGDSSSEETKQKISDLDLRFDLIIDDGSHTQHDILTNFMIYWHFLRDDGAFIIEDCHTDFSSIFAKDNYYGVSIYEFFSSLASLPTLTNFDCDLRRNNTAYYTMRRFHSKAYCDAIVDSVKELTFINSCILINKGTPSIGRRILNGDEWPVAPRSELESFSLDVLRNITDQQLPDLAVVYLNRGRNQAEMESRERFVRAYQRFSPKVPHVLYVVNKGFSPEEMRNQYIIFKELRPVFINVDDKGVDLMAYRKAAGQIEEPFVFFMNTYSEPIQPGWLDKVYAAFTSNTNVGLVGCSGSAETHHPFLPGFPQYPNYHIRTNGFMIARQDYLDITEGQALETKEQAYRFECGRQSMSWMMRASGRKLLVVGRNGPVELRKLWRSGIFRSGYQNNLLLADNQSRSYQQASFIEKAKILTLSHCWVSQLHPQRLRWQLKNQPFSYLVRKLLCTLFTHSHDEPSKPHPGQKRQIRRGKRLAVLVPTHLEELDEVQAKTLLHNAIMLKDYPLEIILPETRDPSWYNSFFSKHDINGSVRLVRAEYFGSPAAVNKMGTDPDFYRMYLDFDYILICHLDAWIFHKYIEEWIDKGYDFIGAPLFLPDNDKVHFLRRMAPFGGNGGLSLRRVSSCLRVLETFHPGYNFCRIVQAVLFLVRNRQYDMVKILFRLLRELAKNWRATCTKYNIYEDVFFTIIAPLCGNDIRIPSSRLAMKFSCEVNYPLFQKEIFIGNPPLGIHGYNKYIDSDYMDYILGLFDRKRELYDTNVCRTPPLVSTVMIVKNLISSGRMEKFEQALMSVIQQTYGRLEIVLLDGKSTDGTYEALRERYSHLPRIVFHQRADQSVWEGMANGVDLATGDLIAIMNSDDYFCTSEALELMVGRLVATNADMVYGLTQLLTDQGAMPFPTHLPSVLNCFGVVHQATLIKKSVIQTIQPFSSGHITSENYLFVSVLMAGFKIAMVPEILVHYRVGGVSTDLYGGVNQERTIVDYVRYMKKLTTVGRYLSDDEIKLLYGFTGMHELGPIRFSRMILKIRDRRLALLLLSGLWNQMRLYGISRLIKGKALHIAKRVLHGV